MWDADLGGSPAAICRYCNGDRQQHAPRSPRPSGLRPGARGGRSSACAGGVGATLERAERAAFNPRACACLRGRIPASGARRGAEEGPLWGSDPRDAHGVGVEPTRPRSAPRSHPASGSLLLVAPIPAPRCGAPAASSPSSTISTYGLRRAPCIRSVLAATHHAPIYEIGSRTLTLFVCRPWRQRA
jgi:hypothetical protein